MLIHTFVPRNRSGFFVFVQVTINDWYQILKNLFSGNFNFAFLVEETVSSSKSRSLVTKINEYLRSFTRPWASCYSFKISRWNRLWLNIHTGFLVIHTRPLFYLIFNKPFTFFKDSSKRKWSSCSSIWRNQSTREAYWSLQWRSWRNNN